MSREIPTVNGSAIAAGLDDRSRRDETVPVLTPDEKIDIGQIFPIPVSELNPNQQKIMDQLHSAIAHVADNGPLPRLSLELIAAQVSTAFQYGQPDGAEPATRIFDQTVGNDEKYRFTREISDGQVILTRARWDESVDKFVPTEQLVMAQNPTGAIDLVSGYILHTDSLMTPVKILDSVPYNFGSRYDQLRYLQMVQGAAAVLSMAGK